MSKVEAGRVMIESSPFDIRSLITGAVNAVLPQARYKDLPIKTDIALDTGRLFVGDGRHIRRVLLILLSNAVKFTEHGEVTLRVTSVGNEAGISIVRFEVKDTGIGIAPTKQTEILEPLTQTDASISRVYDGTELGATTARQLVTLMGGTIGVQSTVGVGSLFWFQLPLPSAPPLVIKVESEGEQTATPPRISATLADQQVPSVTRSSGDRILVADDNATDQRVTQLILERDGYRVTVVDSGEAALDALEHDNFDMALFDLSMPGVSGLEAIKLYRFTTNKPIPILMLSATASTDVIARCRESGAAEFVTKPVCATALLDAVKRHRSSRAPEFPFDAQLPRVEERQMLTVIETPVVDRGVLADLARLSKDPTFVERLVRDFHSDVERLVHVIRSALVSRNYEEVKVAAHALKCGAGSVGATQLVALALRFERASHEMLRRKARSWTQELVRAADAVARALDVHRQ